MIQPFHLLFFIIDIQTRFCNFNLELKVSDRDISFSASLKSFAEMRGNSNEIKDIHRTISIDICRGIARWSLTKLPSNSNEIENIYSPTSFGREMISRG